MSTVQGQVSALIVSFFSAISCGITMCDCCRQLQDGNILQHGVADGSKVTLLPNVETGLVVSTIFDSSKKRFAFFSPISPQQTKTKPQNS